MASFGLPYNPHYLVCFFSRNSIFLSQQFSQNSVLQPIQPSLSQYVKDSRPCKTETEAFIGRVWSGTLPFADNSYLNHWWWTIYKHYLCSCTRAGEQSEHVNFSFWLLFKETISLFAYWLQPGLISQPIMFSSHNKLAPARLISPKTYQRTC